MGEFGENFNKFIYNKKIHKSLGKRFLVKVKGPNRQAVSHFLAS